MLDSTAIHHEPWNKGKLVGQKAPFKLKEIWAIRFRLQLAKSNSRPCALQPRDTFGPEAETVVSQAEMPRNRRWRDACFPISACHTVLPVKDCARLRRARERASRGPDGCAAVWARGPPAGIPPDERRIP